MGRAAKHNAESIVAAAMDLIAEGGPQAATIGAIAQRLNAPTGSIYYRYKSREELLGELWLTVVEGFQAGLREVLASGAGLATAVKAALFMPRWVRDHPVEARLLLLHNRRDFVKGAWPEKMVERAQALGPELTSAVYDFATRLFGEVSGDDLLAANFAILSVPHGAVRPYVQAGVSVPAILDDLIRTTCRAVLKPHDPHEQES
jgi:AcrR family transcriptional regulator